MTTKMLTISIEKVVKVRANGIELEIMIGKISGKLKGKINAIVDIKKKNIEKLLKEKVDRENPIENIETTGTGVIDTMKINTVKMIEMIDTVEIIEKTGTVDLIMTNTMQIIATIVMTEVIQINTEIQIGL